MPAIATPEDAPIYVVVCANDKPHPRWGIDKDGPIVYETYTKDGTLDVAKERAAQAEQLNGACRIARLVFEDDPAFATTPGAPTP